MYFSVSFGFVCEYVSQLIGWEDYYSRDIFRVEGFPLQRLDWRISYCNCLLFVFQTRNIVIFLVNFTCLIATYFLKARYSLFMLKVLLSPNQSIKHCRDFSWVFVVWSSNYAVSQTCLNLLLECAIFTYDMLNILHGTINWLSHCMLFSPVLVVALPLTFVWPHLRCDVGLEAGAELQNCLCVLCIVMCIAALWCCTAARAVLSGRLMWLFQSLLVWLLSFKCLCNLYLWHYVLLTFILHFFTLFRCNFLEIEPLYAIRPFVH